MIPFAHRIILHFEINGSIAFLAVGQDGLRITGRVSMKINGSPGNGLVEYAI